MVRNLRAEKCNPYRGATHEYVSQMRDLFLPTCTHAYSVGTGIPAGVIFPLCS